MILISYFCEQAIQYVSTMNVQLRVALESDYTSIESLIGVSARQLGSADYSADHYPLGGQLTIEFVPMKKEISVFG